jgi:hypothetical protein
MKTLLPPFKGITDSLCFCSEDGGRRLLQNVSKLLQNNRSLNDIGTVTAYVWEESLTVVDKLINIGKLRGKLRLGVLIKIE